MDIRFEDGRPDAPRGHALIYFTVAGEPDSVLATYVCIPPIPFKFEKYMPPAFASLMPTADVRVEAAVPLPPIAEDVESIGWLLSVGSARSDDVVHAGTVYSRDPANLMAMTQEAAAEYGKLFQARPEVAPVAVAAPEVDYGAKSESERLAQMTRLLGNLRDSLGTSEAAVIRAELDRLATTLPAKYRAHDVIEAAATPGENGQRLASLHMTRCYKLLNEEYLEVADIESQIRELQSGVPGEGLGS